MTGPPSGGAGRSSVEAPLLEDPLDDPLDDPLRGLAAGLRLSGSEVGLPIRLAGRRATATVSEQGVVAVEVLGRRVMDEVRVAGLAGNGGAEGAGAADTGSPAPAKGAPGSVTVTPLGAVREVAPGSDRAGFDPELEERVLVAPDGPLAWVEWRAPAGRRPSGLAVEWTVPGGRRWRRSGAGLAVDTDSGSTLFGFGPAPDELRVEETDGLALRVRAVWHAGADGFRVRLGVAGDPTPRTLRMLARPSATARMRRGALERVRAERLALETSDPDLDRAASWAVLRLEPESSVRAARAALVTGDPRPAAERLRSLSGASGAGRPDDPTMLAGLAGLHFAWTGDLPLIRRIWPALRPLWSSAPAGAMDGAETRQLLAHAAEELGESADAARLSALAPTVGLTETDAVDRAGPVDLKTAVDRPEAVLEAVVRDVLGVEPDAFRGRVVLRPAPGSLDRLRVRNLAVGRAALELDYTREAGGPGRVRHRFALRQPRGGIPLRVILEPALRAREILGARVDGEAAELTPVRLGSGTWRVPVQVVMDHQRVLVVESAPAA